MHLLWVTTVQRMCRIRASWQVVVSKTYGPPTYAPGSATRGSRLSAAHVWIHARIEDRAGAQILYAPPN
jgi:hypothetical protein